MESTDTCMDCQNTKVEDDSSLKITIVYHLSKVFHRHTQ